MQLVLHRDGLRRGYKQALWGALAAILAMLVLWPLVQLEQRAFGEGGAALSRMVRLPGFATTMTTTAVLAVASSALAVVAGVLLAWCAAMLPRPLRTVGQAVPLLPLMLPSAAAVTGWVFLLSPEIGYLNAALRVLPLLDRLETGPFNIYSLTGIIVVTALTLSSFVYLFVFTGFQELGQELEAAASACGAGPFRRLFTITLPLLRPSILFASSVVFLLGLGQFTVPLLLGRTERINVLTTEMFNLTLQAPVDYGLGAALGSPILLAGVVLLVIQRWLLGEQRRFVVVSAKARHQSRQTSWWGAAAILAFGVASTVLPLAALLYVSLSPFWSAEVSLDELTLRHYRSILGDRVFTGSIWTSLWASLGAVLVVIPLGFACACALLQRSRVAAATRTAIDLLVTLPVAVPASLLGFGLLFAYTRPPFVLYGTSAILIVTYVTLMIGYATRLQLATLLATGQEFVEASSASGASPARTLWSVVLPLARNGIVSAAALTFVLMSHEFTASMMVRSVRTQVMGSVLFDVWTGGTYPEAAVIALVMVLVTFAGVVFSIWVGGSDSLRRL